jgi:hypothetical protein
MLLHCREFAKGAHKSYIEVCKALDLPQSVALPDEAVFLIVPLEYGMKIMYTEQNW